MKAAGGSNLRHGGQVPYGEQAYPLRAGDRLTFEAGRGRKRRSVAQAAGCCKPHPCQVAGVLAREAVTGSGVTDTCAVAAHDL